MPQNPKIFGLRTEGLFIGPPKKMKEFGAIFFQNHFGREKTKAWAGLVTYSSRIEKYSKIARLRLAAIAIEII